MQAVLTLFFTVAVQSFVVFALFLLCFFHFISFLILFFFCFVFVILSCIEQIVCRYFSLDLTNMHTLSHTHWLNCRQSSDDLVVLVFLLYSRVVLVYSELCSKLFFFLPIFILHLFSLIYYAFIIISSLFFFLFCELRSSFYFTVHAIYFLLRRGRRSVVVLYVCIVQQ